MIAARAMRDSFLEKIYQEMAVNKDIFFVSADFGSPILDRIRAEFPERFLNVGIAEQNLINISAGLSLEGYLVFAYAIAPFITMRCYEQIRVNLALLSEVRHMNVNLIGVGAGYSYVVSGPTHQCYEDLTIMRALPNMTVYSPADHIAAAALFAPCVMQKGIKYIRLDAQVLPSLYENINVADGFYVHSIGNKVCLLATGYMVHTALTVANKLKTLGIRTGVIDLFDITHFSREQLKKQLLNYKYLYTLEEGFKGRGGIDAMMFDFLSESNVSIKMHNFGVLGTYNFEIGSRKSLHEKVGIGFEYITNKILTDINCNILETDPAFI